ncbi:MAG TPA: exodeoxyribonuclease VII small subunit [Gammaproteobacteria bacterium]|jgi:exodeoxyribonuclease VII small subunit|nr:exodeoxyribonuclease VII small subunit [Gammaproteobacteria bacterium]HCY03891.1 exodeoxyribonuclease VII small subunit [Gammaproteobacteria bacterium]|tara:strand:+ start:101 stop:349 length:249 start_codon:yes stop_codon:yes gene_type:complete
MSKNKTSDQPLTFESAMTELEQLVEKMEDGELTLDESLKAFERGVVLTRLCQNELKNAELKVQQLNSDGELEALEIADPENV